MPEWEHLGDIRKEHPISPESYVKRAFDLVVSLTVLIVMSPVLLVFGLLIFIEDFHQPFYFAPRMGRGHKPFTMIKFRSMSIGADRTGVDSTSSDDKRITHAGRLVRRYKIDELTQLVNVLKNDMSIVGPRPNVERETALYTVEEKRLLSVQPGITDLSSIVFSDEGDILMGKEDPDLAYNQLIRPWKGRLGLFYIDNRSFSLDLRIMLLTALAIVSRTRALAGVVRILEALDAPADLRRIARRDAPLMPTPPPGATRVVTDRLSVPV